MVVLWLGCRCCRPSVNTIDGRIMVGLLLSSISKHNIWSHYGWVCRCCLSVNTIYGLIKVGLHCRLSVNTICGRNKFAFVVVVVRQ
jgi:hypothetical protein